MPKKADTKKTTAKKTTSKKTSLKKSSAKKVLPFVSVCTPTFNRRPFIDMCIKCFKSQDYPKELMEWIVIDDGTDSVEDKFKDIDKGIIDFCML